MNKPHSSKKMTQVAVASALGLALLVGGSTYALWSATSTANTAATITTGDLAVTASAPELWSDVTVPATPVQITDLSAYRMAPGDSLQLEQDLNAVVVGNNITGILNVSVPNTTASAAILAQAQFAVQVYDKNNVLVGSVAPTTNTAGSLSVTINNLPQTDATGDAYRVVVTVTLPTAADNDTKLQTISLSDMVITLDQGARS